jgi:NDP-hexose-3-ketoreductase
MRALVLGHSSIARRRVLPALEKMADVTAIDIASHNGVPEYSGAKSGRMFQGYDQALSASDADLVYVSLPNALHVEWILAALAAGKHVVVDKPAALTLEQAKTCLGAAQARGLMLAEATVFSVHPQITILQDFVAAAGPLTHISAHFLIPPLPGRNFRNDPALGGGCLLDMGAYAAAVARLFAGTPDDLVAFAAPTVESPPIDTGFSLLARFANGVRYAGHFSFESEYQNSLELVCVGGSVSVERIFSPPPDYSPILRMRRANKVSSQQVTPADVFEGFLAGVTTAIASGQHGGFASDMLRDAQFREAISASLELGSSKR